jgi:hypothetical protein
MVETARQSHHVPSTLACKVGRHRHLHNAMAALACYVGDLRLSSIGFEP